MYIQRVLRDSMGFREISQIESSHGDGAAFREKSYIETHSSRSKRLNHVSEQLLWFMCLTHIKTLLLRLWEFQSDSSRQTKSSDCSFRVMKFLPNPWTFSQNDLESLHCERLTQSLSDSLTFMKNGKEQEVQSDWLRDSRTLNYKWREKANLRDPFWLFQFRWSYNKMNSESRRLQDFKEDFVRLSQSFEDSLTFMKKW